MNDEFELSINQTSFKDLKINNIFAQSNKNNDKKRTSIKYKASHVCWHNMSEMSL